MTEEILETMKQRKQAKNTTLYLTLDKKIKKMCKNAKENWCNQKCDEIEEHLKVNGTKQMHQSIKELVGKKKSNSSGGCIKDKEGNMLFEKDKILERWSEYIENLFSYYRPPPPTSNIKRGLPILINGVKKAVKNFQL